MAQFEKLTAPIKGTPIRFQNGQPVVANDPIIPFIRGDGTGVDIWPATQKVLVTPELMARLHALEGQSSSASKAVGALAEALLEALKEQESCLLYTSPSPRD